MREVLLRFNGCDVILEHNHKYKDVSEFAMKFAKENIVDWLEKGMPKMLFKLIKRRN